MPGQNARVSPCFTPGAIVATEDGPRAVETLRPGMHVLTRDDSWQELAWVGRREIAYAEMVDAPALRPVLIRADAFGPGCPDHDLEVSPEHRLLVDAARARGRFLEPEVLVAARHLIDGEGIVWGDVVGATYIHLMFDRHQVVLASGLWSESFLPDDVTRAAMATGPRQEIETLFPVLGEAGEATGWSPARRIAQF